MRTSITRHRLVLFFLISYAWLSPAHAQTRECSEWQAIYAGQPDENGARVYAAFGEAEPTMPLPLTLTGVDRKGAVLWDFRTIAWCFQGSGGCFMDLKMTDGTTVSDDTDNPIPLLFVQSSPADAAAVPDILVVAGLSTEFLHAQRGDGPMTLAVTRRAEADEIIMPPQVFYFDRCTDG